METLGTTHIAGYHWKRLGPHISPLLDRLHSSFTKTGNAKGNVGPYGLAAKLPQCRDVFTTEPNVDIWWTVAFADERRGHTRKEVYQRCDRVVGFLVVMAERRCGRAVKRWGAVSRFKSPDADPRIQMGIRPNIPVPVHLLVVR